MLSFYVNVNFFMAVSFCPVKIIFQFGIKYQEKHVIVSGFSI